MNHTLILSSCSIGRRRRKEVFPIYQRECRTDDRCCLLLALGRSCPDFQWQYFTDRDIIVVPISIVSVSPFILEFSSSIPGVFNFDYSIGFSHNILPMVPLPNWAPFLVRVLSHPVLFFVTTADRVMVRFAVEE